MKLLIKSASQVMQACDQNQITVTGNEMKNVAILNADNEGLSIAVDNDGNIAGLGTDSAITKQFSEESFDHVIDATGCCVLPGLVDAHTHPVWAGDRVHEFAMKLAGATYMDVHKAGGGIHFTVEHTRKASQDELSRTFKERLKRMIKCGTTLVECKSGYGLDVESELKMLRVIEEARRDNSIKIDISTTFCGAHAVPRGKTSEEATDDVIKRQLPAVREEMEARRLTVDNIDVFCEKSVFDVEQTRRILQSGVDMGLMINFHGDELHPMRAAELGSELKAQAISHLEEISDDGIKAMAKSQSVAVILPTTAYILRLRAPPVRKMIDSGVPVALGSDFNPNAFCLSMPTVMHLACVNFKMSMEEALIATTINAAAALGKSQTHGSVEVGKRANLLLVKASRWEHLVYQFAGHDFTIAAVICGGEIAYDKQFH
uniref:Probable imidazolonepropionase n=1 Tax=Phallusia mammillata TaxID=59560 RepID=A0A6F9D6U7_9ASCI|nr:probable imidazolonepropionase [Phallusia mammillata]